jgi:hypothetical protein
MFDDMVRHRSVIAPSSLRHRSVIAPSSLRQRSATSLVNGLSTIHHRWATWSATRLTASAIYGSFSVDFRLVFGSQLILVDFQGGVSSVGAWDCRLVHPGDGPYPLGGS